MKSNFAILSTDMTRVIIQDIGPWDEYMTVTNDAENVVKYLIENGFLKLGQRLFYCDSEGVFDEILVKDGKFDGFALISEV